MSPVLRAAVVWRPFALAALALSLVAARSAAVQESAGQDRPNIVLIFPDNLGMGEVSSYGGPRGVPTPNIDRIGEEGIRLTNFNVEYSCVESRIAVLTGRYGARTGEGYRNGMTLWEVRIAEALGSIGYATALYGKWHVGGFNWLGRREPTHQRFDECPMTQVHFPALPHPDFAGSTGAGDIGDAMADVDYNVGLVLDALDRWASRTTRSSSGAPTMAPR